MTGSLLGRGLESSRNNPQSIFTRKYLWLWGLTAAAFIARLAIAGRQSFWSDEIGTVIAVKRPLLETLAMVMSGDVNPPLFYIIAHFWAYFGEGEVYLRALPALFGALCIPAAYLFWRKVTSEIPASIAALMLFVSPLHLYYGIEFRYHTLLTFLALLSWWRFLVLLQSREKISNVPYVIFTVAGFYTHYFFLAIYISQVIYLLVSEREYIRRATRSVGIAATFFIPGSILAAAQLKAGNLGIKSMVGHGDFFDNVMAMFHYLTIGHSPINQTFLFADSFGSTCSRLVFWFGVIALLTLVVYLTSILSEISKRKDERREILIAPFCFLVIPALSLLMLDLIAPVFEPKFLLPLSAPFFLLLTSGMLRVQVVSKWLSWIIIAAFLSVCSISCIISISNSKYHRDNWRGLARFIELNEKPGDVLVNFSFELEHYYMGALPRFNYYPKDSGFGPGLVGKRAITKDNIDVLENQLFSEYDRIWIRKNKHPGLPLLDEFFSNLIQRGTDITPMEVNKLGIESNLLTDNNPGD